MSHFLQTEVQNTASLIDEDNYAYNIDAQVTDQTRYIVFNRVNIQIMFFFKYFKTNF